VLDLLDNSVFAKASLLDGKIALGLLEFTRERMIESEFSRVRVDRRPRTRGEDRERVPDRCV